VFPPDAATPAHRIYVVNHGWHTGLVVKADELPPAARPPASVLRQAPYIEMGWGDEGFYRAQRITPELVVLAIFWPTPTILHMVAVEGEVAHYFGESGLIAVDLSEEGHRRLCDFIANSYQRDAWGDPIDSGPGIYGASRFYRAAGSYYFPNTCNKWTARGLRAAGCPITPCYAIRAENVFRQTRRFGEVIHEFKSR
jgi:uncharacterized protein (TIGR02117 family)